MIKYILKQFLYGRLYIWLKPNLYGLLFVILGISSVFYIHSEYLNYIEISNDNYLIGLSFIIKNIVILFLLIGYLIFQIKLNGSKEKIKIEEIKKSNLNDSASSLEYFLQDEEINE